MTNPYPDQAVVARAIVSAIAWMFIITHARAVDHIRTSERLRKHDRIAGLAAHGAGYDHTIEAVLARNQSTPDVDAALVALTLLQREAVELTYRGDLTGQEASRILRIPLPTFKARLRGAMLALRAANLGIERAER